jgi:hypothetical protein
VDGEQLNDSTGTQLSPHFSSLFSNVWHASMPG